MKRITLLITTLIFFLIYCCNAQQIHSIRFVHFGNELKPIGTVVISVEKKCMPHDKPLDSLFGKSIQVKMTTFKIIELLIRKPEFKTNNPADSLYQDGLKIMDNKGLVLYLFSPKYKDFFAELQVLIKDPEDRNNIVTVFPEHY